MFEVSRRHLDDMSDERLLDCLETNTNHYTSDVERLRVFVPEALARGLALSARTLEIYGVISNE